MSGKEIACFSGAAQNSSHQTWYPSYNYTSLPSLASNAPVAWRVREVELFCSCFRSELMVSGPSLSLSANTSLLLRNSSLSPVEPKLDKDDKCDGDDSEEDGDDGEEDDDDDDDDDDDGEEDGDDEPSARSKELWNNEVLMLVFKLLFVYLMFLFGCTKCLHALNKRTYRDFGSSR